MPAPRRTAPRRQAESSLNRMNENQLLSENGTIFTGSARDEKPLIVRNPTDQFDFQNSAEKSLMKFSQLIMMGIALAAIWGGLFSIAFADDATNSDFLILFLGGFLSAGIAIGWIAAQSKKNDYVLYEVQDYMLGIGIFFATVGTVWGSRWLIGFLTGEGITDMFGAQEEFLGGGWTDAESEKWVDWHPNANGIYVQTAAVLALIFAEIQLFKRFKGTTGFGRAVAAYAPILILVAAGMGPWMRWTDNVISYEMGISLILLCFASMEMALRSNKALNFVVVAVVSGLTPILFELFNTNAEVGGEGGALSLLVFIIAIQGYYASKEELRSGLIQKASIVLIGEIVFAMFIARTQNLNLHLGPIKSTELGIDHLFGLSVALWIAVLAFYFPAVQQRRVPWMPIGLAAALVVLPNDGSVLPWAISLFMIPYMLFIAKATRRWVADYTFATLAVAYFLTDVIANIEEIPLAQTFGYDGMHIVIPIALFTISEIARRKEKISPWTHLVMLASLVLSRTILQAEEWFMPWIFGAYMLYIARDSFSKLTEDSPWENKLQATFIVIIANVSMVLLALLDRLDVPSIMNTASLPEHFNYQIFLLGAATYILLYRSRTIELDAGLLFNWTKRFASNSPAYDNATNTWNMSKTDTTELLEDWQETNSWTQLTRFSLLLPFMMMSLSLVSMSNPWDGFDEMGSESLIKYPWILLLFVPVYGLVHEIRNMEVISSVARSAGVWVLFAVALPVSLSFKIIKDEMLYMSEYADSAWLPVPIVLDVLLLSAPLYVNNLITKRGIDDNHLSVNADVWAMLGLVAFACLDTSGGLLLLTMLGLVTVRSVRHRHVVPLLLSPAVFILLQATWINTAGIARLVFESFNSFSYDFTEQGFLGLPRICGVLIAGQMTYAIIMDNRLVKDSDSGRMPIPWYGMWGWALVGVLSASTSVGWIPAIFFAYLMVNSWLNGSIRDLPFLHFGFMVSLIIGMIIEDVNVTFTQAFSWSALLTALVALGFSSMDSRGILFKNVPASMEEFYTEEKRLEISNTIYIVTYVLFILSFEVFMGIGTVLGAIILTRDILVKGYTTAVLFAPAIHGLALSNLLIQLSIDSLPQGVLLGGFLFIEGMSILWLSLQNDRVYDLEAFEWGDDNEFLDFMDRLGISGVLYTLSGIMLLFSDLEAMTLGWLLTTAVLIAVGMQGYAPDNEARWRRIIGGYGSIFSFIAFSSEIENDTMQSLSWIGVGLIALGWGFLMMQRLDDDEGIYSNDDRNTNSLPSDPTEVEVEKTLTIPEPVTEDDSFEESRMDDDEDNDEDESEETETRQSDEDSFEESQMDDDEDASEQTETSQNKTVPRLKNLQLSSNIETNHEFEIRLPPGKLEAILQSVQGTPHDGFKPVVSVHENGKIVIDWVELTSV